MKLLVLGGKGMAGHVMVAYFKKNPNYQVYYTSRDSQDKEGIFLDVTDLNALEQIIDKIKPDIVVNCIGILNEDAEDNPFLALQVNSFLPHQLVKLVKRHDGKLIHISTDCVFSGADGDYTEKSIPDGTSQYSKTKQYGEIKDNENLTIRTSIIGPEVKDDGIGLFLWFMKQTGKINGYEKVFWNGVTTLELAKATEKMIDNNVTGLYHLCVKEKISKYQLLKLFQQVFNKKDVQIIPEKKNKLDRTIVNTRTDYVYNPPTYRKMLTEMKEWMKDG
ncbi:dTDP-4-dehydrorhamnose reductase family protein [Niallia taxi]|uniref:dTDP-4-dehydrorhamnose reductase family protein n=1 Tax=Niallia taxi TaxID=2499688 RepID=UPI003D2CA7C8